MGRRRAIRVRGTGGGSYPVFVGRDLLARPALDLAGRGPFRLGPRPARIAVISDSRVAVLYGRRFVKSLVRAGLRAELLTFPAGERHKTREMKARLEDRLARLRFGGDGLVVALGGGVTGDLGGFVAATWHRGVALVQAPTTLIAQLDAAIGGKVAVDHPLAKNLIGAFHAPAAVYADTAALETLPMGEFRAGLAEALKCGAVLDSRLFDRIESEKDRILAREPRAIERLVLGATTVKARVVSGDALDRGARKLLNFGHTLGHALEAASGFRLRHGEAVAIGVVLESRIAVRLGLLAPPDLGRIATLVADLGLPVRPAQGFDLEGVLEAVRRDKKVREGRLQFVLPSRIGAHAGEDSFVVPVPVRVVRSVLADARR